MALLCLSSSLQVAPHPAPRSRYWHGKWLPADLQRAPWGWSTALFQSLVSSGSMMTRTCETTWAFSSLVTLLAFTQGSGRKKPNPCSLKCRKLVFSYKSQVLPCLTSFLLCNAKLVRPPFQNTLKVVLTHPLLIMVYFIFMAAFLHWAVGLHRNPDCQPSRRGTQDTCIPVSRESSRQGYTPAVCMPHFISSVATGLNSPQKCPLLLFPFSLWGSRGPNMCTWIRDLIPCLFYKLAPN